MIFDVKNETLPREELEKLQLRRLQALCERVYANVPFYRKKFDEKGLKPADIRKLEDVRLLPFTEKQDLRNHYPFGMFAVSRDQIVRIHSSSGTTGKATVVGYTKRDLETWGQLMARSFVAAGATARDMIHNAYGYGLFTGGLGAHYGGETLGAAMVPISGGATRRQVMLLKDFESDVLCCTPSYALFLAESAAEMGIDIRRLPLRIGIFGAEPWTEEMRRDIEAKLGIKAIDIYGLSEVMGPGVAIECEDAQDGLHIQEDHFLAEIIDPDSGEKKAPDEEGELVFTTLTKEGIPLLRYRTRDLTTLNATPCRCGRTTARMRRVTGRSDDMLIIRGVNVFPSQIESILIETEGLTPHYQLIIARQGNMDTLEVQVEVNESMFSDEIKNLQRAESKVTKNIKEFLGVTAKVKLVEPKTIARSEGKAKRIIDKRNEG
ncbi:MAG: phenylacetate--CoA ligase [Pseudodesulfovibrio sp.]|uniref:Phenylacetate-coenzyme A ligase n=1 Tax=Pseudodesulfovibrio aespoeensis (strain ATCC 700646 / DSM 10631 / Aspo-2) TaxID=643562 RepID=E6VZ34_PSEA9|nr:MULTISPECIES: phenylacetate--CoA ligase [Pseudodesulfovibrio]MBU4191525.1 phenylacetate--CoA ligase [Pseudomonadota bacterium]ADU62810.1 Phenylacetate--CoA ligase [Pseudodesulfovibrio aespoeensis Aspo-2]MBU4245320.1 phenylacetate--CoA ligase [Pseudomonadota bacterium]MBU4379347.1 phenylacetate--CoA ligase [Pseudomonadota bacterium]MBU4475202.1 phenylacetate--CoA ligase [Pseudomonadota bacterium]